MSQEKKYDIFISYRREGGKNIARLLKTELGLRGYNAFLDFDELKDGRFDKRIMDAIDAAPVFMFILSEHALDRCVDENDWVRKEIEYAMATERHIIPINPDKSFSDFPEYVPKNLKDGLGLHQFSQLLLDDLFNQTMDKLVAERLEPILGKRNRYQMSTTGATIHLSTDANCEVYRYGKHECNVVTGEDKIVYLKKGKHKFEFISIDNEKDKYSIVFSVEDIDTEDLIEITLLPTIHKREQEEHEAAERARKEKEAEEARQAEEARRLEQAKREALPEGEFQVGELKYKASENSGGVSVCGLINEGASEIHIPSQIDYGHYTYDVDCIGDSAFYQRSRLTSITIPNSVTSIGERAFYECYSLTSITIPNSVTSIGECAFVDCSSLSSITIPDSVKCIENYAFRGCSSLTAITIPNSVTSIGERAFYTRDVWDRSGLTSIIVEKGNKRYDSRENCNAIIETASNTLIAGCKNTIIPNSVTSIGDWAWEFCKGLTSITIPNSVTSIGYKAFIGCKGLTSITIPNSVMSIGEDAFWGCSGLTSIIVEKGNKRYDSREKCNAIIETASNTLIVGCKNTITIPNSVTSIGEGAFYDCSGLTSITIPNSVTSIGEGAFQFCSGLTSITIPNSVTRIGEGAFRWCEGLTSITIPNSVTRIGEGIGEGTFEYCKGLTSITIPNSVTRIGYNAFKCCSGLTSITIPNSVTEIESWAFEGCKGLTSITIPNSVTSIEYHAFFGCDALKSVKIPKSVTYISGDAFPEHTQVIRE